MKHKFTMAILTILGFCTFQNTVEATTSSAQFTNPFISKYHYVDGSGAWGSFEKFTRSDGQFAYCIQPNASFQGGVYQGFYNLSISEKANALGLSESVLSRSALIAHFGYGYGNHNNDEWYVATQTLIWQTIGRNFAFTSQNNPSNPWKYIIDTPAEIQSKMNEIENLVATYQRMPAFNSNHTKIGLGEKATFIDMSNNLSGYNVVGCENCNATIQGNNLIVTPTSTKSGNVTLNKGSSAWNTDFIVYTSNTSQNLLVPGIIDPVSAKVSFEVVSGSLNLKKYDSITKSCNPDLIGTTFGLYKEDNTFIKDLVITNNCTVSSSELPLGNFYLLEKKSGKNYELDTQKHYFNITLDNPIINITLYNTPFLGKLTIHKYDKWNNSCHANGNASLKNAVYGVYKKDGTLVTKLTINENCTASTQKVLLVGDYFLKELQSPKGYKLDPNTYSFSITPDNYQAGVTLTLNDEVYFTELFINKTYLAENGVQAEIGATFDIISNTSKRTIATLVIDESAMASIVLPYDDYTIRQVKGKAGYKLSDDIHFTVNEKAKDKSYITLLNEPYSTKIKVKKVDQNGKNIPIAGIKFKIYDIINKKYVCQSITYPSVSNVCVFETNSDGEFVTPKELFPSKYRLEEIEQDIIGYLWNSDPIEFIIDENTPTQNDPLYGIVYIQEFVNHSVTGNIIIKKFGEQFVSENGMIKYDKIPLANVVFGLYKNDQLIAKAITGSDGTATFSNLELGLYTIKELSNDGSHSIDSKEHVVELKYVDSKTPVVSVSQEIQNYIPKGHFVITKIDENGNKLSGVEFIIYGEDQETILFQGVTNSEGIIDLELPLGHYYYQETKALESFQIDDKLYEFEIKAPDDNIEVTMSNKMIVEIPKTGLTNIRFVDVVSIVMIVSGLGFLVYDKHKKKK